MFSTKTRVCFYKNLLVFSGAVDLYDGYELYLGEPSGTFVAAPESDANSMEHEYTCAPGLVCPPHT